MRHFLPPLLPRPPFLSLVLLPLLLAASAGTVRAQALGFGAPAPLNNSAPTDSGSDAFTTVTTNSDGRWHVAWQSDDTLGGTIGTDYDALQSRSTDGGATWTAVELLNSGAATDSAFDYGPVGVAACGNGGNWVAVWGSSGLGAPYGFDYEVLVTRSSDHGATWSAPVPLRPDAASDNFDDWFPQIAADADGHCVAVWDYDYLLTGDRDIAVSRSSDYGATWTVPVPLNSNAATDSGWDRRPTIAIDGGGGWIVAWMSLDSLGGTIGTDLDILFARSFDNGATWSAPAPLNTNASSDSGDDDWVELATDGSGNWVAVWQSTDSLGGTVGADSDILCARSLDGWSWSAPAAVNSTAASDSAVDQNPAVAADNVGQWVVVWGSNDSLGGTIGTDYDMLVASSTDFGASWTPAAALNANAATDSGDDYLPAIATDGLGVWIAAWASGDTLGGTIGTDGDILVATSTSVPVELSSFLLD